MSNFMKFLEQMGQDAQLRYATSEELEKALLRAQIEPAVRAAVLAGDRRELEMLLGATPNIFCAVLVPEDVEDEEPGKGRAIKMNGAMDHGAAVGQAAL
jgi:hypothetical protein